MEMRYRRAMSTQREVMLLLEEKKEENFTKSSNFVRDFAREGICCPIPANK
jgi:hypothetical protein